MGHRDEVVLKKVLDEICVAQSMMGECAYPEFAGNEMLKRAVCMTVINIGGLVKNLSENCQKGNPPMPWKAVAGFRDIAAQVSDLENGRRVRDGKIGFSGPLLSNRGCSASA